MTTDSAGFIPDFNQDLIISILDFVTDSISFIIGSKDSTPDSVHLNMDLKIFTQDSTDLIQDSGTNSISFLFPVITLMTIEAVGMVDSLTTIEAAGADIGKIVH